MLVTPNSSQHRPGISLVEVMVTMAVIVAIGGVLAPTIRSISSNTKSKAAEDTLRGRVADARGAAIEEARPYRLAISPDGLHLRVAPDDRAFVNAAASDDDEDSGPIISETDLPKDVKIELESDDGGENVVDEAGWIRVATFLPDGTCREDSSILTIREPGVPAIRIRIRGLTGTASKLSGAP
ncbi:MAG: pilus assembly FimT family protein [Fimbriiglobus sp.]